MHQTYKNLLKKLHEKYPKKHIYISLENNYYDHSDKYKVRYTLYVAGVYCKHLPTLAEVKLCVEHLCKKGG